MGRDLIVYTFSVVEKGHFIALGLKNPAIKVYSNNIKTCLHSLWTYADKPGNLLRLYDLW